MNYTYPPLKPVQAPSLATEQSRQRLVTAIISCTTGMAFRTEPHQQQLLDRYARGRMTIDEVVYSLEAAARFRSTAS